MLEAILALSFGGWMRPSRRRALTPLCGRHALLRGASRCLSASLGGRHKRRCAWQCAGTGPSGVRLLGLRRRLRQAMGMSDISRTSDLPQRLLRVECCSAIARGAHRARHAVRTRRSVGGAGCVGGAARSPLALLLSGVIAIGYWHRFEHGYGYKWP